MEKIIAIAREYFEISRYAEENDENISSEEFDGIFDKLDELENRYYEAGARYHWAEIGIESSEIEKGIRQGYKRREFTEELVKLYEDNYSPTR